MGSTKMEAPEQICVKQTNQLKAGFWHYHTGKHQSQACKTRFSTAFSTSTSNPYTETGTQNSKS